MASGHMRGACKTRILIMKVEDLVLQKYNFKRSYLGIQLVQSFDCYLNVPTMDRVLNLLPCLYRCVVLLWLKIGFFREFGCGIWVPFGGQIIQNQRVDIAAEPSAFPRFYLVQNQHGR
jgi:hypothetical protein